MKFGDELAWWFVTESSDSCRALSNFAHCPLADLKTESLTRKELTHIRSLPSGCLHFFASVLTCVSSLLLDFFPTFISMLLLHFFCTSIFSLPLLLSSVSLQIPSSLTSTAISPLSAAYHWRSDPHNALKVHSVHCTVWSSYRAYGTVEHEGCLCNSRICSWG